MRLVDDWKDAWKWYSIHGATVVAIASAAYASLPYVQSYVSPSVYALSMSVMGLGIIVLRLLAQVKA